MPWPPQKCKSVWAGCSGVFYLLPAVFIEGYGEKLFFFFQAVASVLADYVYIGRTHPIQGIDRYYASFNVARWVYKGATDEYWPLWVTMAAGAISCFAAAGRAKKLRDFGQWERAHFWWHVTGGVSCACLVYKLESQKLAGVAL